MPRRTRKDDPKSSKKRLELAFSAAIKLRDAEDWEGAERMLRRIVSETEEVPPAVNAVLGHVLWEQSKCAEAIPFLQHAARQSPRHEGISLSLFHCLDEVGRVQEALAEGERFLKGTKAGEYREYRNIFDAIEADSKKNRT